MTTAELGILGLIVQEPRYGYQIERVIEERGMREWADIGLSTVYYLLAKLEKKRFIRSRTEDRASHGPARRVYTVTSKGMEAWRRATLQALAGAPRWYTSFLVGLASLPGISAGRAAAAIASHRDRLSERRELVRRNLRIFKQRGEVPWHVELMFDLSLKMTEAELAWVKRLVSRMQSFAKRKVCHVD